MKAIERVKQYIDYHRISRSSFETKIGLSNGYIATQLRRNADLGEGVLLKIINNCLDINPEWLLTGKGEMLKLDTGLSVVNESETVANDTTESNAVAMIKDEMIAILKKNVEELRNDIGVINKDKELLQKLVEAKYLEK